MILRVTCDPEARECRIHRQAMLSQPVFNVKIENPASYSPGRQRKMRVLVEPTSRQLCHEQIKKLDAESRNLQGDWSVHRKNDGRKRSGEDSATTQRSTVGVQTLGPVILICHVSGAKRQK